MTVWGRRRKRCEWKTEEEIWASQTYGLVKHHLSQRLWLSSLPVLIKSAHKFFLFILSRKWKIFELIFSPAAMLFTHYSQCIIVDWCNDATRNHIQTLSETVAQNVETKTMNALTWDSVLLVRAMSWLRYLSCEQNWHLVRQRLWLTVIERRKKKRLSMSLMFGAVSLCVVTYVKHFVSGRGQNPACRHTLSVRCCVFPWK